MNVYMYVCMYLHTHAYIQLYSNTHNYTKAFVKSRIRTYTQYIHTSYECPNYKYLYPIPPQPSIYKSMYIHITYNHPHTYMHTYIAKCIMALHIHTHIYTPLYHPYIHTKHRYLWTQIFDNIINWIQDSKTCKM